MAISLHIYGTQKLQIRKSKSIEKIKKKRYLGLLPICQQNHLTI